MKTHLWKNLHHKLFFETAFSSPKPLQTRCFAWLDLSSLDFVESEMCHEILNSAHMFTPCWFLDIFCNLSKLSLLLALLHNWFSLCFRISHWNSAFLWQLLGLVLPFKGLFSANYTPCFIISVYIKKFLKKNIISNKNLAWEQLMYR